MTITGGQVDTERTAAARRIPQDTFANRLMLARALAGHLSIRDAADLCGLGRGAWTNWERGARPLDKDEITETISEKLGVDLDWLRYGGPLASPASRLRRITASSSAIGPDLRRPRDNRPGGYMTVRRNPLGVRRPERLSPPIAA